MTGLSISPKPKLKTVQIIATFDFHIFTNINDKTVYFENPQSARTVELQAATYNIVLHIICDSLKERDFPSQRF